MFRSVCCLASCCLQLASAHSYISLRSFLPPFFRLCLYSMYVHAGAYSTSWYVVDDNPLYFNTASIKINTYFSWPYRWCNCISSTLTSAQLVSVGLHASEYSTEGTTYTVGGVKVCALQVVNETFLATLQAGAMK